MSGKRNTPLSPNRRVSSFGNTQASDQEEEVERGKYGILKQQCDTLQKDIERRKEKYVAAEVDLKYKIRELEAENRRLLQERTRWMNTDGKVEKIRSLHKHVIRNIEQVQSSTSQILQNHEVDLLRAFRARLFDVETELEKEKSKSGDTSVWVEKCRQLEAEIAWRKEVDVKLRQEIVDLVKEVRLLKGDVAGEEDNKEYIIKQLVLARKEVIRLKELESNMLTHSSASLSVAESVEEDDVSTAGSSLPEIRTSASANNQASASRGHNNRRQKRIPLKEEMQHPDNMENKLRKLLAEEKKKFNALQKKHTAELARTSELERLLRACVDDVRRDIARRQLEESQLRAFITSAPSRSRGGASTGGGSVSGGSLSGGSLLSQSTSTLTLPTHMEEEGCEEGPEGDTHSLATRSRHGGGGGASVLSMEEDNSHITIDSFLKKDRDSVIEKLLNKERAVLLLYGKVFPGGTDRQGGSSSVHSSHTSGDSAMRTGGVEGGSVSPAGSVGSMSTSTLLSLSNSDIFGASDAGRAAIHSTDLLGGMKEKTKDSRPHRRCSKQKASDGFSQSDSASSSPRVHIPTAQSTPSSPTGVASETRPGTTGLLHEGEAGMGSKDVLLHHPTSRATTSTS